MGNYENAETAFDEAFFLNEDDFEAALGMANSYEGLGDNYYNGTEGFEKDFNEASRWYRKAEKKITTCPWTACLPPDGPRWFSANPK